MTREKLSKILDYWREGLISKSKVLELICGQPFEGETEKINTAKSASSISPIPQTNPAPQKTQWTRRVVADVTTREGDIIRVMSGWENKSTTTPDPTQPQMSNQTKCRHCDGSGYTYEHTGRDILPVRCSECDNADSHPWNQEMDTEDSSAKEPNPTQPQ